MRRIASGFLIAAALAGAALADAERETSAFPPLPPLKATTLAGESVAPGEEGRGAVTVLVLWSPESLASRKSIGELARFAEEYRRRGVRTFAVSTLPDTAGLRRYAAENELSLPLLTLGEHTLGPLPEHRLPLIYLLDRDGRVRAMHTGLFRLRDLAAPVDALLAE